MGALTTVPHTHLVAVTAAELPVAQRGVAEWCRAKILELAQELREQRENHRQAKALKWRHKGWATAITKTKARMIYYAKLQLAVRAGYLIVPNFDVDVVAVRVQKPPVLEAGQHEATADVAPPGEGRYVDDQLKGYTKTESYTDYNNKPATREVFHPTAYENHIDFPVALVKPAILQVTERAMARKLFDRIGVVRGSKRSDPIVVGQILAPGQNAWARRQNPKCVTFFIAWWLNTRDL